MHALLLLLASMQWPVIELPSATPGDTIAVVLTGDGGWRRIDAAIADRLRERGISVVGFSTPAYFRDRRTPDESARALEQVIRASRAKWKRPRVILIGFSRGADVLPFMASRLPADLRASTRLIALLGLEKTIDFKYHASWIPFYHPREPQFPVLPEVEKLRAQRILCVWGEKESDSLCPLLGAGLAMSLKTKGSHHFAGNYRGIADAIVDHATK
jgi:type IV secretory pathway VirJ component